jgi:hypothetical protein
MARSVEDAIVRDVNLVEILVGSRGTEKGEQRSTGTW